MKTVFISLRYFLSSNCAEFVKSALWYPPATANLLKHALSSPNVPSRDLGPTTESLLFVRIYYEKSFRVTVYLTSHLKLLRETLFICNSALSHLTSSLAHQPIENLRRTPYPKRHLGSVDRVSNPFTIHCHIKITVRYETSALSPRKATSKPNFEDNNFFAIYLSLDFGSILATRSRCLTQVR